MSSQNNKRMYQILDDEKLEKVSGGDYGDADSEVDANNDVHFMYKVGDIVEVYNTKFHITTQRGIIVKAYKYLDPYDGWRAYYEVKILEDGSIIRCLTSDHIERKG